jgi:hypothetical protein
MRSIYKSGPVSTPSVQRIQALPEIPDQLQILFLIGEAPIHPDIIIPRQPVPVRPPLLYLAFSLLVIELLHLIRPPGLPVGELISLIYHPELEEFAILCKLKLLI